MAKNIKPLALVNYGKWIFVSIFFALFAFSFFCKLTDTSFDVDEYHFLRKSYYFDLFFTKRDLNDPRWYVEDEPEQPKVGTYIYGLSLHFAGVKDIEATLQKISFNKYKVGGTYWWLQYWWKKLENVPKDFSPILNLIFIGRKTAILFSIAALFMLFLVCLKTNSFLFGFIAVFMLGTNGLIFDYGRRATTDSMLLFFQFSNLLLVFYYLKTIVKNNLKKIILLSLLIGVNCALGLGVKIVGILSFLFFTALIPILFIFYRQSRQTKYRLMVSFILVSISFFSLFVFLHPFVHENTVQQFYRIFADRLEGARETRLTSWGSAVYSRWDAIKLIVKNTLLPKGLYTNFKFNYFPLDLILFIAGFYLLVKRAYQKIRFEKTTPEEFILSLWTITIMVSFVFYLNNDWARYYLPTVAVVTTAQAYTITLVLQKYINYIKKRFS